MVKNRYRDLRGDELTEEGLVEGEQSEGMEINNEFWLKKQSAEIYSDEKELSADFTLSNLSDDMLRSRVFNYIVGRMELLKLLEDIFPYANKKIPNNMKVSNVVRERIKWETLQYKKTRNQIRIQVNTLLVMSRARGGNVLYSWLNPREEKEDGEVIEGEEPKRSIIDKILGKNKIKKKVE